MKKYTFRRFGLYCFLFIFFLLAGILLPSINEARSLSINPLRQTLLSAKIDSVKEWRSNISIWQNISKFEPTGDRLNQAITLSNQALTHQQNGQIAKANQAIAQSLAILRSLPETPEQQRIYAASLDILGQLHITQGRPDQAIESWKQAEQKYTDLNFPEHITNNRINQAIAMQQLGLTPRACQTLLMSLGQHNQSCPLDKSSFTALLSQPITDSSSRAQRQLGSVLLSMGNLEQAHQIFSKAAQQAKAQGDTETISNLFLNLGNTARAQGIRLAGQTASIDPTETNVRDTCLSPLPTSVTGALQQSAACYDQASQQGSETIQLQAKLNLASLVSETQHLLGAPSSFLPDISLVDLQTQLNQIPTSHNAVMTRLKWVHSSLCLASQSTLGASEYLSPVLQQCRPTAWGTRLHGKQSQDVAPKLETVPLSEIEKQATLALQQAQEIRDPKATANALGYLGAIALQKNQIQQGRAYTENALQQVPAYASPETNYLWLWQLGRIHQRQGRTQEAIAAYSSAHQILKNLRSDLVSASPDIQFAFRDGVEPVYRELVELLLPNDNPSQTSLAQAREVIESLQLAELHNFYQQACLEARPQAIETIDQSAAVIYAIALRDRLAVITSIPNQPLKYHNINFGHSSLSDHSTQTIDQTVNTLRASMSPYNVSRDPLAANRQVYDWLVRPSVAEFQSKQIQTLVFVLDGALRGVPLAALHDGQSYLVENFNVALTPGLQLLSPRSLSNQKPKTLAAGLTESVDGNSPLPEVETELQNISEVLPTQILLNSSFTRNRLEQSVQDVPYNIVHLATHAQFSSKANQTYLLAWDNRINVNSLDAVLRERERRLTGQPIELLILSACQTAAGDNRAALGLAGVAMRSGARSTVASLWSIQDRSTAMLMTQFYDALSQPNTSKADALRKAQLDLLRSPEYKHPYYWAAFVLVGNWL